MLIDQFLCEASHKQAPTSTLRGLRLLTRQRSELMDDVTRFKNRLAAIQRVEGEIKALVKQEPGFDEDVQLLCSIPGIGFNSAVVIVAEMGDISLFRKPKQLAAYFGLDPGERQSGTFKGRKNKLSKRGSPQVRAELHMAAVSSVSRNRDGTYKNPVLAGYYEKKCAEKPKKVAHVAVMRKLSNIIYAVLRDRKPFELRTPQEHMRLLAAA